MKFEKSPKTAVLLINLGSPDEPTASALKPYLREFLSDRRVVDLNPIFWQTLLNLVILPRRSPKSAARYAQVWMKEGAPLKVYTDRIADKLRQRLQEKAVNADVFVGMRYGNPSQVEVFKAFLKDDDFIKYVLDDAPESAFHWDKLLKEHAELLKVFEEEKKFNMTIDEAKRVRIVDFLAQLGHRAQYMKSEQYWYLSPLRKEVTPSFKVNDRLNEWYDFGEATGGDLVELGKYLCGTKSVSEALAYIKRYVNGVSLPKTRALPATSRPVEADMKNLIIVPLRHHALLSYLHSRMIDSDIGRMFCKEVHYELRQRRYFALAFGNISGGFQTCLTNEGYCSFMRYFQRKTHTGKSGADNEKIELSYHRFCVLNAAKIV